MDNAGQNELTRSRFLSIDALRGIAAFLVVIYHAFGGGTVFKLNAAGDLSASEAWQFIPGFGYMGVYLFFVISGFCIHLRWAKARSKDPAADPKVDFFAFWRRRWIRLYPAYLAAIALFLGWEYYEGVLHFTGFFVWDMVSHVLMIHNLDSHTVFSMNGVFWTLAIEEQLYLLYFLLLFLRSKLGWGVTLGITFASRFLWLAVCLIITRSTGFDLPFTEGSLANWWIWAMGALAVENYFGVIELPKWCRSRTLAAIFLISGAAIHFLEYTGQPVYHDVAVDIEPVLWGAGFFFLINYAVSLEKTIRQGGITYRAIAACAFVGLFSYSLYLTHELVIQPLAGRNVYVVCVLCLVFAYAFFLIFERPFMLYLARQRVA